MNQEDIWTGSYYDLSIEFPLETKPHQLKDALSSAAQLKEFSLSILDDPLSPGELVYLQGSLREFPCMLSVMVVEGEATWLDFSIPVQFFDQRYDVTYPLTIDKNQWLIEINEIYIALAQTIYDSLPFQLAMIGEEVAGMTTSTTIDLATFKTMSTILPPSLQDKLQLEATGEKLSHNLRFYLPIEGE